MKHVLVVDDLEEGLLLVCRMLEISGFETACCTSGMGALKHIEEHGPSVGLVITDWAMPKVDGLEVCKQATKAGIPAIILTAHKRDGDRQTAFYCGAVEHIVKPIIRADLTRIVEQHMSTDNS